MAPVSAALRGRMLLAHQFACSSPGMSTRPRERTVPAVRGDLRRADRGDIDRRLDAQLIAVSPERRRGAPSARVFAIVPMIGFTLQEHLEHLVASRELEVTYFISAPFLLGLALQLPFAFAALFVARLILGIVAPAVRAVNALRLVPGLASLRLLVPLVPELLLARCWPPSPRAAHLPAAASRSERRWDGRDGRLGANWRDECFEGFPYWR